MRLMRKLPVIASGTHPFEFQNREDSKDTLEATGPHLSRLAPPAQRVTTLLTGCEGSKALVAPTLG